MLRLLLACCLLVGLRAADGPLSDSDGLLTGLHDRYHKAVVGLTCRAPLPGHGPMGDYFGTGAVITGDGLVLTNTTVIPPRASEIRVYFTDGRVRQASLLAEDLATEAVLIAISAEADDAPWVHMPLADSDQLPLTSPVVSWGNPYNTIRDDGAVSLSQGRLSGRYQVASVDDQSRYVGPVLETDAALNPGSDGGPLTDCQGNLVGVMSLAYSATRWLGTAIPSTTIHAALPSLAERDLVVPVTSSNQLLTIAPPATVLDRVGPAVVQVWVERAGDRVLPPAPGTVVDRRDQLRHEREFAAAYERLPPRIGNGTGVVIDAQGHVLTSAFLVGERRSAEAKHYRTRPGARGKKKRKGKRRPIRAIWVYLPDGRRLEAERVATSTTYDLAVLRLADASGVAHLTIPSDPPAPATGRSIALLGRSEAYDALTVNVGIVSATARLGGLCFQHSAMQNYGNSGGPVIDQEGTFLGLANQLDDESSWRQNCGVGFAIHSAELAGLVPQLIAGEEPPPRQRPKLGIRIDPTSERGLRIDGVQEDSGADRAGLQAGDVLIRVEDRPIDNLVDLTLLLLAHRPGDTVTVVIRRDGRELDRELILDAR